MADRPLPSPEVIRQLLEYDADTGTLYWRDRPDGYFRSAGAAKVWRARFVGNPAGSDAGSGYMVIRMFGKGFKAHRIAWAIAHGSWPVGTVDHVNGDRGDNRLINLRDVSRAENSRNVGRTSRNTSGEVGVSWLKARGKWRAYIRRDGKVYWLGCFDEFHEAVLVRRAEASKLGFPLQHGRRPSWSPTQSQLSASPA